MKKLGVIIGIIILVSLLLSVGFVSAADEGGDEEGGFLNALANFFSFKWLFNIFQGIGYGRCVTSLDCDDYDECTEDICLNGNCVYEEIPGCGAECYTSSDCNDYDECTEDICLNGNCVYEEIPGCVSIICGNYICEDGENPENCPEDCHGYCPDGYCGPYESCLDCPEDCPCVSCSISSDCNDYDECTEDICTNGNCVYKQIPGCGVGCDNNWDCYDNDECTEDICANGNCVYEEIPGCGVGCISNTDCIDSDPCTTDKCINWICSNKVNPVCEDCISNLDCSLIDRCFIGTCVDGECKFEPVDCDDNYECTKDSCVDGACSNIWIPGCVVSCDSNDDCNDNDKCTTDICLDGNCVYKQIPGCGVGCDNNWECEDDNECTEDSCANGNCVYKQIPGCGVGCDNNWDCYDGDECTEDICANGNCVYKQIPGCGAGCDSNDDCNDGDNCNGLEYCKAGTCKPGTSLNCDDWDECTEDSCNSKTGLCEHIQIPGCGSCEPIKCDNDGDCGNSECATGKCQEEVCVFTPYHSLCDDGDDCNGNEYCDIDTCNQISECKQGEELNCNDYDECTEDSCNPSTGCKYKPLDCDDNIECTVDSCDSAYGCTNTPSDELCPENFICSAEGCIQAKCLQCSDCDNFFFNCNYEKCHDECNRMGECYYKGFNLFGDDCIPLTEACKGITSCAGYSDEECENNPCEISGKDCILEDNNCIERPPFCGDGICSSELDESCDNCPDCRCGSEENCDGGVCISDKTIGFPGNTLVLMADNTYQPISEIKEGDSVIAFSDFENNIKTPTKVKKVFNEIKGNLMEVVLEGSSFKLTEGNYIFTTKGWKKVKNSADNNALQVGDEIILDTGNKKVIEINFIGLIGDNYHLLNEHPNNFIIKMGSGGSVGGSGMVDCCTDDKCRNHPLLGSSFKVCSVCDTGAKECVPAHSGYDCGSRSSAISMGNCVDVDPNICYMNYDTSSNQWDIGEYQWSDRYPTQSVCVSIHPGLGMVRESHLDYEWRKGDVEGNQDEPGGGSTSCTPGEPDCNKVYYCKTDCFWGWTSPFEDRTYTNEYFDFNKAQSREYGSWWKDTCPFYKEDADGNPTHLCSDYPASKPDCYDFKGLDSDNNCQSIYEYRCEEGDICFEDQCLDCVNNDDCTEGKACLNHKCVSDFCKKDEDCESSQDCSESLEDYEGFGKCIFAKRCKFDRDCGENGFCYGTNCISYDCDEEDPHPSYFPKICTNGKLEPKPCSSNEECSYNPPNPFFSNVGWFCQDSFCKKIECTNNNQCVDSNLPCLNCIDEKCLLPWETIICPDGYENYNGECVEITCNFEYCYDYDENYNCVYQCNENQKCVKGENGKKGICVDNCNKNRDCKKLAGDGLNCINACKENEKCSEGVCIPKCKVGSDYEYLPYNFLGCEIYDPDHPGADSEGCVDICTGANQYCVKNENYLIYNKFDKTFIPIYYQCADRMFGSLVEQKYTGKSEPEICGYISEIYGNIIVNEDVSCCSPVDYTAKGFQRSYCNKCPTEYYCDRNKLIGKRARMDDISNCECSETDFEMISITDCIEEKGICYECDENREIYDYGRSQIVQLPPGCYPKEYGSKPEEVNIPENTEEDLKLACGLHCNKGKGVCNVDVFNEECDGEGGLICNVEEDEGKKTDEISCDYLDNDCDGKIDEVDECTSSKCEKYCSFVETDNPYAQWRLECINPKSCSECDIFPRICCDGTSCRICREVEQPDCACNNKCNSDILGDTPCCYSPTQLPTKYKGLYRNDFEDLGCEEGLASQGIFSKFINLFKTITGLPIGDVEDQNDKPKNEFPTFKDKLENELKVAMEHLDSTGVKYTQEEVDLLKISLVDKTFQDNAAEEINRLKKELKEGDDDAEFYQNMEDIINVAINEIEDILYDPDTSLEGKELATEVLADLIYNRGRNRIGKDSIQTEFGIVTVQTNAWIDVLKYGVLVAQPAEEPIKLKVELKAEKDSYGQISSVERVVTGWMPASNRDSLINDPRLVLDICEEPDLKNYPIRECKGFKVGYYAKLFDNLCKNGKNLEILFNPKTNIKGDYRIVSQNPQIDEMLDDFNIAINLLDHLLDSGNVLYVDDKDFQNRIHLKLAFYNQMLVNDEEALRHYDAILSGPAAVEELISEKEKAEIYLYKANLQLTSKTLGFEIEDALQSIEKAIQLDPKNLYAKKFRQQLQLQILEIIKSALSQRGEEIEFKTMGAITYSRRVSLAEARGYGIWEVVYEGERLTDEVHYEKLGVMALSWAVEKGYDLQRFYGTNKPPQADDTDDEMDKWADITMKDWETREDIIREAIKGNFFDEYQGVDSAELFTCMVTKVLEKNPDIALLAGGGTKEGAAELAKRLGVPNLGYGENRVMTPEIFAKESFMFKDPNNDYYAYKAISDTWRDFFAADIFNLFTVAYIVGSMTPFAQVGAPAGVIYYGGHKVPVMGWIMLKSARYSNLAWRFLLWSCHAKKAMQAYMASNAIIGNLIKYHPRIARVLGFTAEVGIGWTVPIAGHIIGGPVVGITLDQVTNIMIGGFHVDDIIQKIRARNLGRPNLVQAFVHADEGARITKAYYVLEISTDNLGETIDFLKKDLKLKYISSQKAQKFPTVKGDVRSSELINDGMRRGYHQFYLDGNNNILVLKLEKSMDGSLIPRWDLDEIPGIRALVNPNEFNLLARYIKNEGIEVLTGSQGQVLRWRLITEHVHSESTRIKLAEMHQNLKLGPNRDGTYIVGKEIPVRARGGVSEIRCCPDVDIIDPVFLIDERGLLSIADGWYAVKLNAEGNLKIAGTLDTDRAFEAIMQTNYNSEKIWALGKIRIKDSELLEFQPVRRIVIDNEIIDLDIKLSKLDIDSMETSLDESLRVRGYRGRSSWGVSPIEEHPVVPPVDLDTLAYRRQMEFFIDHQNRRSITVDDEGHVWIMDDNGARNWIPEEDGFVFINDQGEVRVVDIDSLSSDRNWKLYQGIYDSENFVVVWKNAKEKWVTRQGTEAMVRAYDPDFDSPIFYNQDTGVPWVFDRDRGDFVRALIYDNRWNVRKVAWEVIEDDGEITQMIMIGRKQEIYSPSSGHPVILYDKNTGNALVDNGISGLTEAGVYDPSKNAAFFHGPAGEQLVRYGRRYPKIYDVFDGDFYNPITGDAYVNHGGKVIKDPVTGELTVIENGELVEALIKTDMEVDTPLIPVSTDRTTSVVVYLAPDDTLMIRSGIPGLDEAVPYDPLKHPTNFLDKKSGKGLSYHEDTNSFEVYPPKKKSSGCFLKGTDILTTEGDKDIEEIKRGDEIISWDFEKNKKITGKVIENFARNVEGYYIINNKIKVTGEHPFFVITNNVIQDRESEQLSLAEESSISLSNLNINDRINNNALKEKLVLDRDSLFKINSMKNGKWKKVSELKVGDKLFDGEKEIVVESIEYVDEQVEVYNMQVDNFENYFAEGILVHNKAKQFDWGEGEDFEYLNKVDEGGISPENLFPRSRCRYLGAKGFDRFNEDIASGEIEVLIDRPNAVVYELTETGERFIYLPDLDELHPGLQQKHFPVYIYDDAQDLVFFQARTRLSAPHVYVPETGSVHSYAPVQFGDTQLHKKWGDVLVNTEDEAVIVYYTTSYAGKKMHRVSDVLDFDTVLKEVTFIDPASGQKMRFNYATRELWEVEETSRVNLVIEGRLFAAKKVTGDTTDIVFNKDLILPEYKNSPIELFTDENEKLWVKIYARSTSIAARKTYRIATQYYRIIDEEGNVLFSNLATPSTIKLDEVFQGLKLSEKYTMLDTTVVYYHPNLLDDTVSNPVRVNEVRGKVEVVIAGKNYLLDLYTIDTPNWKVVDVSTGKAPFKSEGPKLMKTAEPLFMTYEKGTVSVDGEFGEIFLSVDSKGVLTVGNSVDEAIRFRPDEDFVRFVSMEGDEIRIDYNAIRLGENVKLVDLDGGRLEVYNPEGLGLSLSNQGAEGSGVIGEIVYDPLNPDILHYDFPLLSSKGDINVKIPKGSETKVKLTPDGDYTFKVYNPDELIVNPDLINKEPDLVVMDPDIEAGELRVLMDDLDTGRPVETTMPAEWFDSYNPLPPDLELPPNMKLDAVTRELTVKLPDGGKMAIFNPEALGVRFNLIRSQGDDFLRVYKPPKEVISNSEIGSVFNVEPSRLKGASRTLTTDEGYLAIYNPERGIVFYDSIFIKRTDAGRIKSIHHTDGRQIAFDSEKGVFIIGNERGSATLRSTAQGSRNLRLGDDWEIIISDVDDDVLYALLGSDLTELPVVEPVSETYLLATMKNTIREAESKGLLIPIIDEFTPENKALFAKAWHELDDITVIHQNPDNAMKLLRKLLGDISDEPGDVGVWQGREGIGVWLGDYLVVDEARLIDISEIEAPLERAALVAFEFRQILPEEGLPFVFLVQEKFGFPGEGIISFPADIKMRTAAGEIVDLPTGPNVPPEVAATALEFKKIYTAGCFEETIHALGAGNQGGANYIIPWMTKDILDDDGTVLVPSFLRWVRENFQGDDLIAIEETFSEADIMAWFLFKGEYDIVASPLWMGGDLSRMAYTQYYNTYFAGEGKLGLPSLKETSLFIPFPE